MVITIILSFIYDELIINMLAIKWKHPVDSCEAIFSTKKKRKKITLQLSEWALLLNISSYFRFLVD